VPFPFEVQDVEQVISLYHIGTVQNGYRAGAIMLPFIDVRELKWDELLVV
jgi:acyl CoA:acetate/3-ketoacid CoA transferase alpha subunit